MKRAAGAETERDHGCCCCTDVTCEASMLVMLAGVSEHLDGVLAFGVSVGSVVVRRVVLS